MSGLPILVEGSALTVLVVGGGAVAVRKAAAFAGAGATIRVVAREMSAEMRALAQSDRVTLEERAYTAADIGDSMLVIAATDDRSVNAAIAAKARAARRLVNVADAPDEGSFATMATHRAGSLVIGVSAGGVPGAAARVRDAIAARFDHRYAGALSDLVTLRRSLLAQGQGARWRSLSSEVIDARFCDAVEDGELDERVASWR
ncbi:MAG TPA: NAD(P)-dependent oxidoreductase [Gemmatimonadaceae bacterium]|nr:NAD(P)-dependent oxidoreductase [Gemmatimonadaceae bacterium]